MHCKLTDKIESFLREGLNGFRTERGSKPFYTDDDGCQRMRANEMVIRGDSKSDLTVVEFRMGGEVLASMEIPGAVMLEGKELHLGGFEITQRVDCGTG